jgi:peptide chain release factor 2
MQRGRSVSGIPSLPRAVSSVDGGSTSSLTGDAHPALTRRSCGYERLRDGVCGGGAGALRFSRSFFLRRRSFAQRTFGLEPRPMCARLPSGPWRRRRSPSTSSCRSSGPGSTGFVSTFDPDTLTARQEELEAAMGEPGFWDDQQQAARISTEHSRVSRRLERYERLDSEVGEARELYELDPSLEDELRGQLGPVAAELARLQEDALFDGKYDGGDAVVSINAGTGGTDAQDWAEMLLRMYLRWSADRRFQTELVEASPGEEAGLKSATMTVKGENAYGAYKAERGVHRLVRQSPFDSAHRRHTAFAQVVVAPLLPDDEDVEIDEGDLRIDTYRASGAGGQHVNKTDSAVRITHLPTGIVVQCQNERSQASNKATALRILKSRLAELQEEQREEELARERGATTQDIGFGSQIRSYVLHPYQMVKDHRTEFEVGNAQGVLDGDLDGFVRAYLLAKAAGKVV